MTDTHCKITGAPPSFVHVIFATGIHLSSGVKIHLLGSVRAGRTKEMNDNLKQTLMSAVETTTKNIEYTQIEVSLFEFPASWVMEGGHILPEPGDEEGWLKLKEKDQSNSALY